MKSGKNYQIPNWLFPALASSEGLTNTTHHINSIVLHRTASEHNAGQWLFIHFQVYSVIMDTKSEGCEIMYGLLVFFKLY